MKNLRNIWIWLFLFSCGEENLLTCDKFSSDRCASLSKDEEAAKAVQEGDYEKAVDILEALIEAEPSVYERYPRLASVYATLGQFQVLKIAKEQITSGGGMDDLAGFLPDPLLLTAEVYESYIDWIEKARDLLSSIPAAIMADKDTAYVASAEFQLTLYSSVHSLMLLNKYKPSDDPVADAEKLASMSVSDALKVISSLSAAADASSEVSPEMAVQINGILAEIDSAPGATDDEKVAAYIAARNAKKASGS